MTRITEADLRALQSRRGEAAPKQPRRGLCNKTELAFARWVHANGLYPMRKPEHLDFEAERFRIGHGCNYTPDMRLAWENGSGYIVHFYEVKPARRLRTERDSIVRLKAAARLNPMYQFYLARMNASGGFDVTRVEPPAQGGGE